MATLMTIVTVLAYIFGVWSGLIVLFRMFKIVQIGVKYENRSDAELSARRRPYIFGKPLIATIICWVIVIVT